MINSLFTYFHYDFVQNALVAGTAAAILGAIVGYFVVIRKVSFAAHSLAHIGFTGATGAVLFAYRRDNSKWARAMATPTNNRFTAFASAAPLKWASMK